MGDSVEKKAVLTQADLAEGWRQCGLGKGHAVIVHASLSRLGYVVGGAETLIRSLLEVVGEEGTVLMPSQTWRNLDPAAGVHWEAPAESWPVIRAHWPAYDKDITPAVGMGAAAEMLRKWPGARRSDHPARSFAAVGRYAEELTEGHDLSNIFGDGSPLERLYRRSGYVLLIGVGHDKNTSLHLAETRARFPSKRYSEESSAMWINGKREWVTYTTQAVDDSDFLRLGEEYERETGLTARRIGGADVRLLEQRPLVDWAAAWMERHRS
ncbi:aminoglycoside N(3)-acetyltransferase [Paenibacillus mucilaginosus]|uniref:Aminoglycoside N(3)-acetyltransferase n=2 Tax=Paenibacillus mucilaginosus TaxID=61624 RepID=I0BKW1_9BACL|nr:AAC(3) family N-acetyltransferase [Paenibacillus mucilaginosus]AEI42997.1 aminoglycoside N3'-acetyltransferase [Paenibacillus mucilaginosus KNP414]AFH63008.1 aminoglycoside N(3')-acetyltransferase [Paenibacillus mucilaginosus K02]MCG7216110.1 AAC(3) family N-acetyltransferase [Paenibacillus mucilaginosus]WDM24626.1 AAC(3) family N-acetyltransferase [Paenibacillus mucilaginosus]